MAGNDSDKTVLKFLKEKYTREYFNDIFKTVKTVKQQCSWQKTYAWTVANAKFGLGIMLFFIFQTEIEALYVTHIAEQYFDITGWTINELWVFVLAGAIIGYGVIRACFGAVVSGKQARWTAIALGIYAYYRLFDPLKCTFERINIINIFAYTDLFALYGAVIMGRWVALLFKTKRIQEGGFHYDEPLKNERNTGKINQADETLGRTGYANQIAETIIETRSKDAAFAMGITGSWGSGKTSFWRLIENRLRADRDIIIIEYRPWQNHGSNVIVKDFFAVLSQRLRPYDSSLSGTVDTYTKILLDADDSTLNKIVKPIRSLFCTDSTAATEFDRINAALRRIDKQIVIFIDDLDRLDKNEVLEVIRLIRNTANFANVFFVAAYDRGYIMQALEDFNRYNKEAFLEKIFQLEVPLPKFEYRRIIEHLKEVLLPINNISEIDYEEIIKLLDDNLYYSIIQHALITSKGGNLISFPHLFHSFRDVNRFANQFIESYKPIKGNISIRDFICFELLKYKFPSIYDVLFNYANLFLDTNEAPNAKKGITKYRLKKNKESDQYSIDSYCHLHKDKLGIVVEDISHAISLLENIFTVYSENAFSAKYPSSFPRYSYARLSDCDIPEIEFSDVRQAGFDTLSKQIVKWLDMGKAVSDIESKLFNIDEFDSIADFETIIKSQLFYFRIIYQQHDTMDKVKTRLTRFLYQAEKFSGYGQIFVEIISETIEKANQFPSFESDLIFELRKTERSSPVFKNIYNTTLDKFENKLLKKCIQYQGTKPINILITLQKHCGFEYNHERNDPIKKEKLMNNEVLKCFFDKYVPDHIDELILVLNSNEDIFTFFKDYFGVPEHYLNYLSKQFPESKIVQDYIVNFRLEKIEPQ